MEDGEEWHHDRWEDGQRPGREGRRFEGQPGRGGDDEIADPEGGEGVEATPGQGPVAEGQHDGERGYPGRDVADAGGHGKARGQLAERQGEEEGDPDHPPQLRHQHQPQVEAEQVAPEPRRGAVGGGHGGDRQDL
jgi:hypothetical protein